MGSMVITALRLWLVLGSAISAQDTAPFLTTGVHLGVDPLTGWRPARQNVNDLARAGGAPWDLYILSLQAAQTQLEESNPMSYYQLAGIHGRPHVPWNGVQNINGWRDAGYCFHNEVLFISWHRPYLAHFEMVLSDLAQSIANRYTGPEAAEYQAAAKVLRLPYWDWGSDPRVPPATTEEFVEVNTWEGRQRIRNPLFSYRFQKPVDRKLLGNPKPAAPGLDFTETFRCPDGSGQSHPIWANDRLLDEPFRDEVYSVFTKTRDFVTMATSGNPGPSFEAPHNAIHVLSTCDGSMRPVDISAYDPLFLLHHCNVDRLYALWQALNPNQTSFSGRVRTYGAFASIPGTVTADDGLPPFYDGDGKLWTTASVAHIAGFGYTYPEIDDWSQNPDQLRAAVTRRVNEMYGPEKEQDLPAPPSASADNVARSRRTQQLGKDYALSIRVDRADLKAYLPCRVAVFLGGDESPGGRGGVEIGGLALLAMPPTGMSFAEVPLRAPLSVALGRAGTGPGLGGARLSDTAVRSVVAFVGRSLRVEIRTSNGSLIPTEAVPSLAVDLLDRDVVLAVAPDEFPEFKKPNTWPVVYRQQGHSGRGRMA